MSRLPSDIEALIGDAGPEDMIALETEGMDEPVMIKVADLRRAHEGDPPDADPAIADLLGAAPASPPA